MPRIEPVSPLLPLLCAALASTCFVGMDATVKVMAARYDALHLGFFRFAGGCAFAIPLWFWKRSPLPTGAAWRLHVARSLALLVSLLGYFYALTELPLVLAVTISYLAPIFVAVLAVPVLHERPSRSIWLALVTALAGVAVSVWPEWSSGIGTLSPGRLLGMASAAGAALAFAFVLLLARRQAQQNSLWTILVVQSVLPLLLLSGPAIWRWQPIDPGDVGLILLTGALGTAGLLLLTVAYSRLEASRVAPVEYSSFIWAAALGFLVFGDMPSLATLCSATLIIGACLLLLRQ